jgi:hypothetical protein
MLYIAEKNTTCTGVYRSITTPQESDFQHIVHGRDRCESALMGCNK